MSAQRDTLIRYLLDELHSYEEDYSESMCPFPQDEDGNFFVGQTTATAPVTVVGLQAMSATMCDKMEDLSIKFTRELHETVSALRLPVEPSSSANIISILLTIYHIY